VVAHRDPDGYLLFNLIYSLLPQEGRQVWQKRVILWDLPCLPSSIMVLGSLRYKGHLILLVYGLFLGLTEGIQKAFLATIIPQDFKATAFGVYNTVVGLAMFPASLIGGWLWDHVSPSATFYFGAITASASAILFIVFITVVRRTDAART
jgi:predicted MFS family arabinose efflux permease